MAIIALGDSITNGFDGNKDLKTHNYPYDLAKLLHEKVDNYGVNAATLSGPLTGDLLQQSQTIDFKKYNLSILFYGTNDYDKLMNSIEEVKNNLAESMKNIRDNNPNIQLMGIIPLPRYDNNYNMDNVKGSGNYTMEELRDQLKLVYHYKNVPALDWREDKEPLVTDQNYKIRYNDSHLHPTSQTYELMAERIKQFIQDNQLIDKYKNE